MTKEHLKGRHTVVAIDPSWSNMGVAIYRGGKFQDHKTGRMKICLHWINEQCDLTDVLVIMEDPSIDTMAFSGQGQILSAAKRYKFGKITEKEFVKQVGMASRVIQDVGNVKAAAKEIMLELQGAKIPFFRVPPSDRDKAFKWDRKGNKPKKVLKTGLALRSCKMPTKLNAAQLKELYGLDIRCSEHVRDAISLFHGRNLIWLKNQIIIQHAKLKAAEERKKRERAAKRGEKKLFQDV